MSSWVTVPAAGSVLRVARAWSQAEVQLAVEELLDEARLPDTQARVFVKPNLNSDLPGLMGNSTDLRLLSAVLGDLRARGFSNICVGDGSNVGVHRREIAAWSRLSIDRLCRVHGVEWLDLNEAPWRMALIAGDWLPVAAEVLDADYLIALPKLKTHQEAGLSLAAKLFVGAVVGQAKRGVHRDLHESIVDLGALFRPDLTIVDGLVAMEGNGPGDGTPRRLDLLVAGDDPWMVELACCRLVGMAWERVPSLVIAGRRGYFGYTEIAAANRLSPVCYLEQAPPPPFLQRLSQARPLGWLKRRVLPAMESALFRDLMWKAGVVQDRHQRGDEPAAIPSRNPDLAVDDVVWEVCPDLLPAEEVGTRTALADCLGCGYCAWAGGDEQVPLDRLPPPWQELHFRRFGPPVFRALRDIPERGSLLVPVASREAGIRGSAG